MHNIKKKFDFDFSKKLTYSIALFFTKKYLPLQICDMIHENILEFYKDFKNVFSFES